MSFYRLTIRCVGCSTTFLIVSASACWYERDVRHILRLVSFSALGMVLYAIVARWLGFPPPDYIIPTTFTAPGFGSHAIPALGLADLGHFAMAGAVGFGAAFALRGLSRIAPVSMERDAWDYLINKAIARHWVVVGVRGGEAYLGMVDHADVAVEPEYRDVILAEPYRYDADAKVYRPTNNQFLFIRGSDVSSIAVVCNAVLDAGARVMPVEEFPFADESNATHKEKSHA